MVVSRERLENVGELSPPLSVIIGDGRVLKATHIGDVELRQDIRLTKVLYVEKLNQNLFSVVAASETRGVEIVFTNGNCFIRKDNQTLLQAEKSSGAYRLIEDETTPDSSNEDYIGNTVQQVGAAEVANSEQQDSGFDAATLHRKAGHTNMATVHEMSKLGILTKMIGSQKTMSNCEICTRGKMSRAALPKATATRAKTAGELIHSDLCGPMRTTSIQGSSYFVTYIDNFSGWTHVEFIRQKSERPQMFLRFQTRFERQHAVLIQILRSDGSGEYAGNQFQRYLKNIGVQWQRTVPHTTYPLSPKNRTDPKPCLS